MGAHLGLPEQNDEVTSEKEIGGDGDNSTRSTIEPPQQFLQPCAVSCTHVRELHAQAFPRGRVAHHAVDPHLSLWQREQHLNVRAGRNSQGCRYEYAAGAEIGYART